MKRTLFIMLAALILCLCFAGCSDDSSYSSDTSVYSRISREDALKSAKQKVVHDICSEAMVSKISIIYGNEEVKEKSDGYMVYLSGHYYPINIYGDLGKNSRFSYQVSVNETGHARIISSDIF